MKNQILDKTDKSRDMVFGKTMVSKITRLKWNIEACKKPGTFMMIPKESLNIDGDYQRDAVSNAKVFEIARNWNWVLFGTIIVAMRADGSFWVIEGGHRARASFYRSDISKLPCMVHALDERQEEAKAFLGSNKFKTNVSSFHEFKAAILAGDEIAVGVDDLMRSHGYTVARHSGTPRTIKCITTITRAFKDDRKITEGVFEFCKLVDDETQIPAHVFNGIFYASKACRPEVILTRDNAKKIKLAGGFDSLIAEINRQKVILGKCGSIVNVRGILNILNKGRRNKINPKIGGHNF